MNIFAFLFETKVYSQLATQLLELSMRRVLRSSHDDALQGDTHFRSVTSHLHLYESDRVLMILPSTLPGDSAAAALGILSLAQV